jgi:hypothetical protein
MEMRTMHLFSKTTPLQPLTKPIAAAILTLMVVASAYLGTQYLGKRAMVTTVLGVEAVGAAWGTHKYTQNAQP